jgi:hypothetical protein
MVSPCGRGQVDGLGSLVELAEEGHSDTERTGSGDRLRDGQLSCQLSLE